MEVSSDHALGGGRVPLGRCLRTCRQVMLMVVAAPLLSSAAEAPVVSAIRYTLVIEVGGQQYSATSVVQRTATPRSALPPELAGSNAFKSRGEGLGIRLADGRAFVSTIPIFTLPPGYDLRDANKVAQFAREGRSFPIQPAQLSLSTHKTSAFIFDSAVAPKTAWKFDWLDPAATLGPGARILRYDMRPTDDPPTFDLGKIVPWVVIDRRPSMVSRNPDDEWFGFEAFRAKVKQPEVRTSAKPVEMTAGANSTIWLDATDAFAFGSHREKLSDMQTIGVQYSDDLTRITLLPEEARVPPAVYVQLTRIPRHRSGNRFEFWSPEVCVLPPGCANILDRAPMGVSAGALINPTTDVLYLVDLDHFTTETFMFQMDER
jgi:hypothetical protein